MTAETSLFATKIKRSVNIDVREWFDKTGGNSYFSALITIDGKAEFVLPLQYGYGDYSKWLAVRELFKRGYIAQELESLGFIALVQTLGIDIYWHKSEAKKKDMFKVSRYV